MCAFIQNRYVVVVMSRVQCAWQLDPAPKEETPSTASAKFIVSEQNSSIHVCLFALGEFFCFFLLT